MMFEPMLSKSQRSFGGKILCRRPNTNDKRGREWSLFKKICPLFKQAVELRHRVERARLRRRPRVHRSRTFRKKVQRPRSGLQQLITKLKKDST